MQRQYDKAKVLDRLEREIQRTKAFYSQVTYIKIVDRTASNWQFINLYTYNTSDKIKQRSRRRSADF
ncbi:hypothetical protein ACJ2PR_36070, partial [Phormidesmis sp. 146-33]